MEPREANQRGNRPKQKFGAGSIILIACCVATAILGIFVGIIVVYGGMQAL